MIWLTLFLLPLIPPAFGLGFEESKVIFFILATSLSFFFWSRSEKVKQVKLTKIKLLAGIFILTLIIASALGINPTVSLLGQTPYLQGFLLYAFLFIFFLIISTTKIKLFWWAIVLSFSSLIVSVLALKDFILLQMFHIDVPTYAGRVVSSFGQPNFYAGFLLLSLPFSWFLVEKSTTLRKLGWLGILGDVLGILVSGSRIAIILMALLIFIYFLKRLQNKKIVIIVITLFLLIFSGSLFLSYNFKSGLVWQEVMEPNILKSISAASPTDSVEKRFYIWPIVWEIINEKPILGSGLETINLSYANYFNINKHAFFEENLYPSAVLIRLKDLNLDRTHNYFLDLLMFSGILGFLSWGILVCLMIKQARNWVLLFSLIFYLIWVQFQNQSVVQLVYFWFLAGLIDVENIKS